MRTVQLDVPDMTCGHCVQAIEGALASLPGVQQVQVMLEGQRATAVVLPDVDVQTLIGAVREAGYSPSLASSPTPNP